MSLYQELILNHYKNPRNFKKLDKPDKVASATNPLCGDKLEMFIKIKNGRLADISFIGEGCAISTASTSMLTEHVKRKKVSDLRKLDKSFILDMLGIELSPNRLKCALLPLEALHKALKK